MNKTIASPLAPAGAAGPTAAVDAARASVGASFERFRLTAGLASLARAPEQDAMALAGAAHARASDKPGCRRGRTTGGASGLHGGQVEMERPRARSKTTGTAPAPPGRKEAAEAGRNGGRRARCR